MNVSPDTLRIQTLSVLADINKQIDEVKREADRLGILPEQVKDSFGNWILIPILASKMSAVATLTELNHPRKEKKGK